MYVRTHSLIKLRRCMYVCTRCTYVCKSVRTYSLNKSDVHNMYVCMYVCTYVRTLQSHHNTMIHHWYYIWMWKNAKTLTMLWYEEFNSGFGQSPCRTFQSIPIIKYQNKYIFPMCTPVLGSLLLKSNHTTYYILLSFNVIRYSYILLNIKCN